MAAVAETSQPAPPDFVDVPATQVESRLVVDAHTDLGESPTWDARTGRLYFVDINKNTIHVYTEESGVRRPLTPSSTPGWKDECVTRRSFKGLFFPFSGYPLPFFPFTLFRDEGEDMGTFCVALRCVSDKMWGGRGALISSGKG